MDKRRKEKGASGETAIIKGACKFAYDMQEARVELGLSVSDLALVLAPYFEEGKESRAIENAIISYESFGPACANSLFYSLCGELGLNPANYSQ